ncbi:putative Microtubule binding protein MIP T3 [Trypanosoma vivax]|uniref:TRAF3-interacting protein 1 n=1 Tax=Trypanosoma vivax (strain Y486) TaxID=1055687 RepID=G0U8X6_TRYVY|nr:hypothetical protein TRVL_00698 [Trypanosoma vivax]KAH8603543.1 putative Microtubule binding protein MIP T3 [Trypanosoma vivax]CCC54058.1 conserved hypothetical protein [Trypanosoma vivax Y486]
MSDSAVDFWTPTVQAFAPLQLSGPELTEKLLKRPPFRFIHDIITSINTRFAAYDHIFSPEQLDATKLDTKEKKAEYLTTLVGYVESLLGQKVDVNVKKILSGSEPERTNAFLQCVAFAVGYAQQDKAKKQAQEQKKQGDATGASSSSAGAAGTATEGTAPAKKTTPNPEKEQMKKKVLQQASDFHAKVSGYGFVSLDEESSVKELGKRLVKIYQEMNNEPTTTQPPTFSVDALETAIKRQMESIQQLETLQEENSEVLENIITLLA